MEQGEEECIVHEPVCGHCGHEFDPDDLLFSCHDKSSRYSFCIILNLMLASVLVSKLVDNNFGLFLLPFFSSDLAVLNYSVLQYLESVLHGRTSEENLAKLRRAKLRAIQGPTPHDLQLWSDSIILGVLFVYGARAGVFDVWERGFAFWGVAVVVSKAVRVLAGQWLGLVVFPGISRGFMKLAVLYVYFRLPSAAAFRAIFGVDYIVYGWLFGSYADVLCRVVMWVEIVGAVYNYLFLPSGVCLTGYISSTRKGHYCCVCEKFRTERCRNCGVVLNR